MSQMLCSSKELVSTIAGSGSAVFEPASTVEEPTQRSLAPLDESTTGPQEKGQETPADIPSPAAGQPAEVYLRLVQVARHIFAAAAEGVAPNIARILRSTREVLEQLQKNDDLLAETVRQRNRGHSWPQRAANVTILSMRLGLELDYSERRIQGLGLCALMHDIGMLKIPDEVLNSRQIGPEQLKVLHQHPIVSLKMVQSFGKNFAQIGATFFS